MANTLEVGEHRIGRLVDGDPDTPEVSVQLERTEDGIVLTVPWTGNSPYARWFGHGAVWGDDPERSRYTYEVPRLLWFEDSSGTVALLGCRNAGWQSNLSVGSGRIRVREAVLHGRTDVDYSRVNGARAQVTALREWLNVTSIREETITTTDTGGLSGAIHYTAPAPIDIPSFPGLSLRPTLGYLRSEGRVQLVDGVQVEFRVAEKKKWAEIRAELAAVRDLLAVSRWSPEHLNLTEVQLADDPQLSPTGDNIGPAWRAVIDDGRYDIGELVPSSQQHLIKYSDIGMDGLAAWCALRSTFRRAIDPLVSSIELQDALVEVRLAQVSIGLEALGYLVAQRDDGLTDNQANALSFRERLERLAAGLAPTLPFIEDAWSQRVADAYNAVKHANRTLPDGAVVANSWRESVLLFRAWIARELGVPIDELGRRLQQDRMINPYTVVT